MEGKQRNSSSSSEEDDFCRISDGGQSEQSAGDQSPTIEGAKQPCDEADSVELSEFCQVVFQNVAESYKPGKPLECYYLLSPVLVPSEKDYIAVFKVGWNSIRHYVTFEYAPYPKSWKQGEEHKQCILFNYHYLPKEEDGEFYQFCYIDSYGKMRGASTPFQFLITPMDDFMEVADESIDFLMIQNKRTANSELIVALNGEKDSLAAEKAQIEKEKNQLVGKVEELEAALGVRDEEVKEFTDQVKALEKTLEGIPVLEDQLAECENKLADLEAEKKRYGESLQQTTEAFMEVQGNIGQLEDERNRLKAELELLVKERDEFKSQFASSEKDNEALRVEIDSLKHQLMEANQQNQVILAKEGALKEEKQKVEQQLLVASSDQDHKKTLEAQVRDLQGKLTKSDDNNRKMELQLGALSDFHNKLKQEYEDSKIECDALKTKLLRQGDDFLKKQKKTEQQMTLQNHQAKEKRVLLETQVTALKQGIQKLAMEKEDLTKATVGSEEASNIAVKAFKDKMMAAKRKSEEESRKRLQVQKDLYELKATHEAILTDHEKVTMYYKKQLDEAREAAEQLGKDTSREIDSLKVRLEMAKKEYTMLYKEMRSSDGRKGGRKGSATKKPVVVEEPVMVEESVPVQAAAPPLATPPPALEESYDSRDMTLNMEEMTRQLSQLTGELRKRKAKVEEYKKLYEEERMRRKESENLYQQIQESKRIKDEENMKKYRARQEEVQRWKGKYNKMHDDYMKVKHSFESYKFDTDLAKSPVKKTAPPSVKVPAAAGPSEQIIPRPPPDSKYGNPYSARSEESMPVATPPGRYRNPYTAPTTGNRTESISGFQSIKNADKLPEPMAPQVTPQARHVAVRASMMDMPDGPEGVRPSAPPMPHQGVQQDEEDIYSAGEEVDRDGGMFGRDVQSDCVNVTEARCTSPTIYHDAPEFLVPAEKSCPQCSQQFAPDVSDACLAAHVQSHFAYQCPECDVLMDRQTYSDEDYKRHRASHRQSPEDLKHFCPFCENMFMNMSPEQLQEHINVTHPN